MTEKRNKDRNVPTLRFPGFNDEWKSSLIGDLMDFKVTNSLSREKLNYVGGEVKNIHYGDIHTKFQTLFNIQKEEVPFINDDVSLSKIQEDYYCKEGDIVFADASEDLNDIGKSIEIINTENQKLLAGLHTLLGRPKPNIFYRGFAGYLFLSNAVRTQIQREAQGAKVLGISVGRISKVELNYPSLEEQKKISSLLSIIDTRIQTQNKIIEELKLLKSTLCDKIYSGFEENYEFETSIGDLIDYLQPNRFIVSSNEYSNDNRLIPVLTANKSFILGYTRDKEGICSIGECVIFDDFTMDMKFVNFPFKVKSSAMKILKPKPGSNIRFLYDYLKFLKLNSGEHKRHYISEIEPKTLKLPNIILQNKVSNLMRSHDSKITIEENILSYLMMLKEYLLKKIFI